MVTSGPLSGIRVLDFGHTVMGPTAGLILADMGAEVIRIEPAGDGDPTRRLKGFGTGYFYFFNRNKGSIAVDLKTDDGRAIVNDLLATADVMLENFGPGTMDRLGFDWDSVHANHPHIVYLSLKGFLPGPWEDRTALDEVVQMMSGLAYMTGPVGQPLRAGTSVIDITGGMFGALGVLAALRERDTTGKGQFVRAALFETATFLMGQHLVNSAVTGKPVPPMPARISAWAIYDRFLTKDDRDIFLGITSDRHWAAFCDLFDRPDLFADDSLATNNLRVDAKDRLKPEVARSVAALPFDEVERRAVAAKLPFAPVARPEDLFTNPHLLEGGHMVTTDLGDGTVAPLPALPVEIGTFKPALHRNPPAAGADTRALLAEIGRSTDQIDALIKAGTVIANEEAPE